MLGTLLKLLAYSQAPRTTFAVRHPVVAAQLVKTPFDLRTAYAPRLSVVATALLVAPLAYRLGKRAGEGTLRRPRGRAEAAPTPDLLFDTEFPGL